MSGYVNRDRRDFHSQQDVVFPKGIKLETFYTSDGKTLKPDLFDGVALNIANSFIAKSFNNGEERVKFAVTTTQLRRIFDEVKRYEQLISVETSNWESQLPYIKMIKSKVAYTVARASKQKPAEERVYKNLETFVSSGINLVKTKEDYHIFVALFEAAYGYYYGMVPRNYQ